MWMINWFHKANVKVHVGKICSTLTPFSYPVFVNKLFFPTLILELYHTGKEVTLYVLCKLILSTELKSKIYSPLPAMISHIVIVLVKYFRQ